jgi:hypothetical protein
MIRQAVLLTGFLRKKEQTFAGLRRYILERGETRLFVATWDIADSVRQAVTEHCVDRMPVTTAEIAGFFGDALADVAVHHFDSFERSVPAIRERDREGDLFVINARAKLHGVYWMNRLFAQWWLVRQGLTLIAEHARLTGWEPDVICRTRTDIAINGPLPPWPEDRVLLDAHLPGDLEGQNDRGLVPDWFTIGPAAELMKLRELCFAIEPLYDRQNADVCNAEELLRLFLVQRDIPYVSRSLPIARI